MQSTKYSIQEKDLELELANRKHNLSVIEETISKDPKNGAILNDVRDLLTRRVADLNTQLTAFQSRNLST